MTLSSDAAPASVAPPRPVTAGAATRVRRWQDAVCAHFVESLPEPRDPQRFDGTIETRPRAGLTVSTIRAAPQTVRRSPEQIRRSPSPHLFFVWQAAGAGHVDHDQGSIDLAAGQGVLIDPDRPYTLTFDRAFCQVCVQLPRDRATERLPRRLGTVLGRPIAAPGVSGVLTAAVSSLLLDEADAEAPTAELFLDILGRAACWMAQPARATPFGTADQGERLRRFLGIQFEDEHLSPASAAGALGCSVRQVHKICAARGTTFGRLLIATRLEAAARLLAQDDPSAARISDVAYACGFGDLSHFCRSFKARYHVPPSAFRRAPPRP